MSLKISNVSYSYGGPRVLENITFSVEPGVCTGLLGANGSGKTTLIKCIIGLLKPKGTILLAGDSPNINSISFKKKFGLVPDDNQLLDYLTLDEYFSFISSIYGVECSDKLEYWLSYFQLSEHRGRIIKNFSYGMRKKVQIISSLLYDPQILIVDEPTNGLDIEMIYLLKKCFLDLKKSGISLLVSTHNADFARAVSDNILILHDKKIIADININEHSDVDLEKIFMSIIYQDVEKRAIDG